MPEIRSKRGSYRQGTFESTLLDLRTPLLVNCTPRRKITSRADVQVRLICPIWRTPTITCKRMVLLLYLTPCGDTQCDHHTYGQTVDAMSNPFARTFTRTFNLDPMCPSTRVHYGLEKRVHLTKELFNPIRIDGDLKPGKCRGEVRPSKSIS